MSRNQIGKIALIVLNCSKFSKKIARCFEDVLLSNYFKGLKSSLWSNNERNSLKLPYHHPKDCQIPNTVISYATTPPPPLVRTNFFAWSMALAISLCIHMGKSKSGLKHLRFLFPFLLQTNVAANAKSNFLWQRSSCKHIKPYSTRGGRGLYDPLDYFKITPKRLSLRQWNFANFSSYFIGAFWKKFRSMTLLLHMMTSSLKMAVQILRSNPC